jgi:septum formation protein
MLFPGFLLASESPRRQQMLSWLGWKFEAKPAQLDEIPLLNEQPGNYVLRLAEQKARMVQGSGSVPDLVVLAADTTVADGSMLLGKPAGKEEAVEMLRQLRGRIHQVYTVVAVVDGGNIFTDLCTTQVPMRHYSDEEIETYVLSGDPFDKAGGYAIQHTGFKPVVNFGGCFASVTGLPLCHLLRTLNRASIPYQPVHPRVICLEHFGYNCPISHRVLDGENVG